MLSAERVRALVGRRVIVVDEQRTAEALPVGYVSHYTAPKQLLVLFNVRWVPASELNRVRAEATAPEPAAMGRGEVVFMDDREPVPGAAAAQQAGGGGQAGGAPLAALLCMTVSLVHAQVQIWESHDVAEEEAEACAAKVMDAAAASPDHPRGDGSARTSPTSTATAASARRRRPTVYGGPRRVVGRRGLSAPDTATSGLLTAAACDAAASQWLQMHTARLIIDVVRRLPALAPSESDIASDNGTAAQGASSGDASATAAPAIDQPVRNADDTGSTDQRQPPMQLVFAHEQRVVDAFLRAYSPDRSAPAAVPTVLQALLLDKLQDARERERYCALAVPESDVTSDQLCAVAERKIVALARGSSHDASSHPPLLEPNSTATAVESTGSRDDARAAPASGAQALLLRAIRQVNDIGAAPTRRASPFSLIGSIVHDYGRHIAVVQGLTSVAAFGFSVVVLFLGIASMASDDVFNQMQPWLSLVCLFPAASAALVCMYVASRINSIFFLTNSGIQLRERQSLLEGFYGMASVVAVVLVGIGLTADGTNLAGETAQLAYHRMAANAVSGSYPALCAYQVNNQCAGWSVNCRDAVSTNLTADGNGLIFTSNASATYRPDCARGCGVNSMLRYTRPCGPLLLSDDATQSLFYLCCLAGVVITILFRNLVVKMKTVTLLRQVFTIRRGGGPHAATAT